MADAFKDSEESQEQKANYLSFSGVGFQERTMCSYFKSCDGVTLLSSLRFIAYKVQNSTLTNCESKRSSIQGLKALLIVLSTALIVNPYPHSSTITYGSYSIDYKKFHDLAVCCERYTSCSARNKYMTVGQLRNSQLSACLGK